MSRVREGKSMVSRWGGAALAVAAVLATISPTPALAAIDVDVRIAALRKAVAAGAEGSVASAGGMDALLKFYRDRLALASAVGVEKADPYAQRVISLLASPSDAAALRKLSEEALGMFDALCDDLDAKMEAARSDEELIVLGAQRRLEPIRLAAGYKRAWVRYQLALTLGGAGDARVAARRRRLLQDARDDALACAARKDIAETAAWAKLLAAMAAARLGSEREASAALRTAAAPSSPAEVRGQAMFEQARLAIEMGRWSQAEALTVRFADVGVVLAGDRTREMARLRAGILRWMLCSRRAISLRKTDPAAALAWSRKAEGALADLFTRRGAPVAAVAAMVVRPWEGREELDRLPTAVVFARGVTMERRKADEAVACYEAVLDRADPAATALKPQCLWRLGAALYRRGGGRGAAGWPDRRAAADRFGQLARECGGDVRAANAAVNAMRILGARVNSFAKAGRPAPAELRQRYRSALETLVAVAGEDGRIDEYRFELGEQHRLLGRRDEALTWYRRVRESSWIYAVARVNEAMLRMELLREASPGVRRAGARQVAADLAKLVGSVGERAAKATDPARQTVLAEAAARAAYLRAELLGGELGRLDDVVGQCEVLIAAWPQCRRLVEAAEVLRIDALVGLGRFSEAVKALEAFADGGGDSKAGRRNHGRITSVALRMRDRIDALRLTAEAPAALDQAGRAHLRFAELACEAVADRPAAAQYPYKQMLAEAMAETGRIDEAMAIFARLGRLRPNDARNVAGEARCHWLAGRYGEAMKRYQRFLAGVDPAVHGRLWWRTQLDLAQCALENADTHPDQRKRLRVRLRQLRARDSGCGGYGEAFERLEKALDAELAKE